MFVIVIHVMSVELPIPHFYFFVCGLFVCFVLSVVVAAAVVAAAVVAPPPPHPPSLLLIHCWLASSSQNRLIEDERATAVYPYSYRIWNKIEQ